MIINPDVLSGKIVHEPHGKPWGVWQHTLVVNSLMCNETIQISRRKSLALR